MFPEWWGGAAGRAGGGGGAETGTAPGDVSRSDYYTKITSGIPFDFFLNCPRHCAVDRTIDSSFFFVIYIKYPYYFSSNIVTLCVILVLKKYIINRII